MPQQIFGAQAAVSMVNRALANTSPSSTIYTNQVAAAGTTAESQLAFAKAVGAQYAVGKTAAELSSMLLTNMGVSNDTLALALTDYITAAGVANVGIVALQLGQILSGLEGDATFGAAATKWNQEVTNSYQYSSSPNNNTPQQGDDGIGGTTLTRFTDVVAGHEVRGYLDYNQFTGADEQTLTTSDRVTGTAAADDVLFAQLTAAGARPTLNGVEIVSIDAKATLTTLDLSDANGVKTVINAGSAEAATLSFTNLKNLVDVIVRNTNSDTVVAFNPTVVAGTADSLSLTVEGAGVTADRASFTANGVETLNIAASTSASVLGAVTSGGVTKLVVTGDQNLSVGNKSGTAAGFTATALATVDASAATGNLFMNLQAAGATNQTVTTGAGNDTVVVSGLTANDSYDLGTGVNRVVVFDAGTNQAAKLTNVQQVEARVAGTNLNLTSAASVNLVAVAELLPPGGVSIANVTAVKSGTTFAYEGEGSANAIGAANTAAFGAVTYNLANATGATDVINVTYSNAGSMLGAGGAVAIGALNNTGNNVETLNFTFSDVGSDDTVTVADINVGSSLANLNVTSASKVTLNLVNDLVSLTSVNASGVADAFTATFGALAATANATVKTGGTGNNNVTVGKAVDAGTTTTTLTVDGSAGSGSQTFTVNNADADVSGTTPSFVFVGGSGSDALVLTSLAGSVNSIAGGMGSDNLTLTASAGQDRLTFALGDTGSTIATADTVTGFVAGAAADVVDLRAFGFDAALQGVNFSAAALNGTANEFGAGALQKAVHVSVIGANTTMYIDTNGDAKLGSGDMVINFVGTAFVANDASVLFV